MNVASEGYAPCNLATPEPKLALPLRCQRGEGPGALSGAGPGPSAAGQARAGQPGDGLERRAATGKDGSLVLGGATRIMSTGTALEEIAREDRLGTRAERREALR